MSDADFDLLQITERLKDNPASNQIADTLDELLFRGLDAIVGGTDILESILIEVLPFTATNARRKFSALDQADFVNHIFSFIVVKSKKAKMKILRRVRMERTLYFKALDAFEKVTSEIPQLVRDYALLSSKKHAERGLIAQHMGAIALSINAEPDSLFHLRQRATFWHYQASQFKQMICEKFVRLAYVETKKAEAATELTIDTKDLFRDLIVSISKAIDKYDSQKGPITTYIQWWFMDAKTQFHSGHEFGVAFNVPVAQRKKMLAEGKAVNNLTVELNETVASEVVDDSESALDRIIAVQTDVIVQKIATKADPFGFACLVNDIPFVLTPAHQAALRATLQ